jgi:hypothetical protein
MPSVPETCHPLPPFVNKKEKTKEIEILVGVRITSYLQPIQPSVCVVPAFPVSGRLWVFVPDKSYRVWVLQQLQKQELTQTRQGHDGVHDKLKGVY